MSELEMTLMRWIGLTMLAGIGGVIGAVFFHPCRLLIGKIMSWVNP